MKYMLYFADHPNLVRLKIFSFDAGYFVRKKLRLSIWLKPGRRSVKINLPIYKGEYFLCQKN